MRPPPRRLLLAATIAPAAEAALLRAVGTASAAALAPQVSAIPPFDLFHDLRWISTYHDSWVVLATEVILAIALRSLWVAWAVQVAWPAQDPPSMPRAAIRVAAFYVTCVILLLPFVLLLFGMALTHLSDLFFAAVPPALAVAVLLSSAAYRQAVGRWWRWAPSVRALGMAGLTFVLVTITGAVVTEVPAPVAVVVAAIAGVGNAWIMTSLVAALAGEPLGRPRRHLVVPAVLALTFAISMVGTAVGFELSSPAAADRRAVVLPERARGRPLLVVSGFNSRWMPDAPFRAPKGFVVWRFSYRGIDGRRLLPYTPSETLQPLDVSAGRMATEVDALYRTYRRPVTILAESEGAMVARDYLLRRYQPATGHVGMLIVLDMPAGTTSVTYPPPGHQGWGVGTGWGLRAMAGVIRWLGPLDVTADAPLLRQMADCGALMRQIATEPPPPGVAQVTVHALADSVDPGPVSQPAYVVAAGHGNLLGNGMVQALVGSVLSGRTPALLSTSFTSPAVAATIGALAAPWRTPGLPDSLTSDTGPC